ncbi:RNA methyltransferase [Treponema sp.]
MRNKLTNELAVHGFNATKALADYHPQRINRLFLREEHLQAFGKVCKYLAAGKRPYKICDDEELERLCKSPRHQGLVAMMEEREIETLSEDDVAEWADTAQTALVLDSVGNDNNLGAIVRSAAFFGVRLIVLSEADEAARLSTSAYRVAEGGMEHVAFRRVRDTGAFLRDARNDLVVIGADHRARNKLKELPALIAKARVKLYGAASARHGLGASSGIAIVLGNEERGLSDEAKAACTLLARIPGTGDVESLNVAQAATLFMHELYELK